MGQGHKLLALPFVAEVHERRKMKIVRSAKSEFIPAGHEDQNSPAVFIKPLLRKDDLIEGRVQMISWAQLSTGKSFRPHYHEDMQEVFVLLKGEARITVDGKQAEIGAGDAVVIPMGGIHKMENTGVGDVEYVVLGISEERGGKTVVV